MNYLERYERWINSDFFDDNTKAELQKIKNDDKEIKERFYKDLEFGTGGIRGIMGAGDNRMNIYTVGKATQGLANYINKKGKSCADRGVAIAYDSRNMSQEFAEITASVLNANGIKSFKYESLRPTPMLSFAVRELNCIAGVVITASHNPPEYNGYKVYWEDGAQLTPPYDEEVIAEVNSVPYYDSIQLMDKSVATEKGLYNIISKDIDTKYYRNVLAQIVNPELVSEMSDKINIVYTPIHGSGNIPVQSVLKEAGFKNVHIVKEQEAPDGNFPTVDYPNPEDPKVFVLGIELAKKVGGDIIIATDPDSDRVGAVVKDKDGKYKILTGNMTGVLLTEYILSHKKNYTNGAVISTIVSTDLTKSICTAHNVKYFETLTGFKYIGRQIKAFEEDNSYTYLFGFEESYGCLAGTYARDKDAVVATLLLCELASFYKSKGMTLLDGLEEIYEKYGYYEDSIISLTLKGLDGLSTINNIMANLRTNPPTLINDKKIIQIRDYLNSVSTNLSDEPHTTETIDQDKSDVLYYVLEDESWFCVRPSGTEPKIKIYCGVKDANEEMALAKKASLEKAVTDLIEKSK